VVGVGQSAVTVQVVAAALTGPYVWRVDTEFGNPLGPPYLEKSITMQRHDPAVLLVNGLRQAQTLFDTPLPGASEWTARGVESVSRALGVNPSDPAITFDNTTYPTRAWYPSEDKAAYPVQALLLVLGVLVGLLRPGLGAVDGPVGRRRAYASVVLIGLAAHTATVKWQPWGNRLFLYLVVLAAPLAGLALTEVFARAARRKPALWSARSVPVRGSGRGGGRGVAVLAGAVVVALAVSGTAGALAALYGKPRRLVGADSVFVLDRWHARFVMRPTWADEYAAVGAVVRDSGARRIGIVQQNDTWEYPWWLLLRGRELVSVQSLLPKHPVPRDQKLDAIVCAGPAQTCRDWAPAGWQVRMYGQVGWALPADRVPPGQPVYHADSPR
jgi:hypothetical protein